MQGAANSAALYFKDSHANSAGKKKSTHRWTKRATNPGKR
jgi:hypothetical protein